MLHQIKCGHMPPLSANYKRPAVCVDPDSPICAACQGACCKNYPGLVNPDELCSPSGRMDEAVCNLVKSGRYAIDWWEGDIDPRGKLGKVYFLRPAVKRHEGKPMHAAWCGACTFLGKSGCQLPAEDRPFQCRNTGPRRDGKGCKGGGIGDKKRLVRKWRKYQIDIASAIEIMRLTQEA
jgi:hypothetical protein